MSALTDGNDVNIFGATITTYNTIIDDNGKGIEESKLKKLNENLNSKLEHLSAHQSIGIINSQARIIGLYGEKYGIKLSNNNQGARITILIPNKRGV